MKVHPLCCILPAALALRLTGIGFGLHHPDEHLVINHALAFGTGDLNPHMFYLPTFFMYLLFGLFGLFYGAGFLTGVFSNPDDFLALFLRQPELFYTLARTMSVFFGVATVGIAYLLGKEFKNKAVGAWAAFFLAVNFLHVRDSHFATMDIALTFFMMLSLYYTLRSLDCQDAAGHWKAVIAAAAAAATKYNGALLVIPIALAYLAGRPKPPILARDLFLSTILFVGVFFCLSPYVLLDLGSTREYLGKLYELNRAFQVPWDKHLVMLWHSLGPATALLAVVGAIRQWVRRSIKNAVLSVFAVLYYWMITKAGQPFERYVLALIPIALIWAAESAEAMVQTSGRAAAARPILGVLLLFLVLPKTLHQDALFLRANTRDLTRDWLARNAAPGEKIIIDDPGEAPRLMPSPEAVREQISRIDPSHPGSASKKKRLEAMLALSPYPALHYRLYFLTDHTESPQFTMLTRSVAYDPSALKHVGDGYLIVSELSLKRAHPEFYEKMRPYLKEVFRADPRSDAGRELSLTSWTYTSVNSEVWNLHRPGPLLYVFKINFS